MVVHGELKTRWPLLAAKARKFMLENPIVGHYSSNVSFLKFPGTTLSACTFLGRMFFQNFHFHLVSLTCWCFQCKQDPSIFGRTLFLTLNIRLNKTSERHRFSLH